MTICRDWDYIKLGPCNAMMIFSLEKRTWYCPDCGNCVRVPREQQSLNEYARKS